MWTVSQSPEADECDDPREGQDVQISGPCMNEAPPDEYAHECGECDHEWTDEEAEPDECPWCYNNPEDEDGKTITTAPHAEGNPYNWLNWAGVSITEREVRLQVSLGDPRGCFQFTIRKHGETGALIMHTPYPEQGTSHADGLKELHGGTYEILGV